MMKRVLKGIGAPRIRVRTRVFPENHGRNPEKTMIQK